MKNGQNWLLIFGAIFFGLAMPKTARKWHPVCKIKSLKSKSGLIFPILQTVNDLWPCCDFIGLFWTFFSDSQNSPCTTFAGLDPLMFFDQN